MKQKIIFAALMAIITTGTVSFTLVMVNRGWTPGFAVAWIKSWVIAYIVALPVIILLSPKLQVLVSSWCKSTEPGIEK
jgi:hypothetical protein